MKERLREEMGRVREIKKECENKCMCMFVCVCVKERERERERVGESLVK